MKNFTYLVLISCLLFLNFSAVQAITQVDVIEVEPNGSEGTGQTMTTLFAGGSTLTKISGTIGSSGDNDYYKITCTNNANLQLTLCDTANPNGGSYTVDAKFYYGIGGVGATSYDSQKSGISISAGQVLYVRVISYYAGDIGSYDLYIGGVDIVTTSVNIPITYTADTGSGYMTGNMSNASTNYMFSVTLDANYQYAVTLSLNDSYNSGSYSGDAEVQYSTDGGTSWSIDFDESSGSFILNGPTILYVRVHAYDNNISYLGTYRINANINRTYVDIKEHSISNDLKISPNPSDGNFSVELAETNNGKGIISITSLNGSELYSKEVSLLGKIEVNTSLPSGVYVLKVTTEDAIGIKRLLIK